MRGQGVAGEQDVEEAAADQLADVLDAAGVDDGRAEHGQDLLAGRRGCGCMAAAISRTVTPLGFSLETGLAMNSNRFVPRRRLGREDAQPLPADDDAVALAHVGHGQAAGGVALRIDEDAAVHLLVFHVDPVAAEADLGAVVGRAVEALGEGAVHVGRRRSRSPAATTGTAPWSWMASRISRSVSARVGADLDAGVAGVVLPLADADVLDDVGAAAGEDLVQHLGQEQRVDDVPVDLDFLDESLLARCALGHDRLHCSGELSRELQPRWYCIRRRLLDRAEWREACRGVVESRMRTCRRGTSTLVEARITLRGCNRMANRLRKLPG